MYDIRKEDTTQEIGGYIRAERRSKHSLAIQATFPGRYSWRGLSAAYGRSTPLHAGSSFEMANKVLGRVIRCMLVALWVSKQSSMLAVNVNPLVSAS